MSDPASFVDVLDPDWRSFECVMHRMEHFHASMLRLEKLAYELSRESDEEYQRRQELEPAVHRQKREERERTLKELVVRALASTDPTETEELWLAVDGMLD